MTFEIVTSKGVLQHYRWRIRANNGKILLSSEFYFNRADCVNAVNVVKRNAATAPVVDVEGEA